MSCLHGSRYPKNVFMLQMYPKFTYIVNVSFQDIRCVHYIRQRQNVTVHNNFLWINETKNKLELLDKSLNLFSFHSSLSLIDKENYNIWYLGVLVDIVCSL